jgi:bifunctional non-homologous end joining protein LigD
MSGVADGSMKNPKSDQPKESPHFMEPMKARLATELPTGEDWLFEIKLDGIRAIALKDGGTVRLFSRRPRELTDDYPEIVAALHRLPVDRFTMDGEIVSYDTQGRSLFQALQVLKRKPEERNAVFLVLFDLLHLNGRDLTSTTLVQRRKALQKLLWRCRPPLRFSIGLDAPPAQLWKEIMKLGLEGVIAKRKTSVYEAGRRSGAWLKIKAQNQQEFVIGGYTAPGGTRAHFGSVLVGYYDGRQLRFASKVGTGFNARSLQALHQLFQKHRAAACPFVNLPTRRNSRFGQGLSAADMKRCTWLKPRLVCQVKFLEWTGDGSLRHPVFVGLREDKEPSRVVREETSGLRSASAASA